MNGRILLKALPLSALLLLTPGSGTAVAQQSVSVQLPEFRFFTVNTTVWAPVNGGAPLGGVSRAGNRGAIARGRQDRAAQAGGARQQVRAQLSDPQLLDPFRLSGLNRAPAEGSERRQQIAAKAAFLSQHINRREEQHPAPGSGFEPGKGGGEATAQSPLPRRAADSGGEGGVRGQVVEQGLVLPAPAPASVAAIRQRNAQRRAAREQQWAAWLEQGRAAEAEGKPGAARIFFHMVAREASGPLKAEAARHFRRLNADRSPDSR